MHRLLSFVFDFVADEFNANTNQITLAGSSMGGAGTSLVGLRNGHIFSNLISWVGIHISRESPVFSSSFEATWGAMEWNVPFSNVEFAERFGGPTIYPEDNYGVWDYYDKNHWLRDNPGVSTPWLTYSNGVNDDGIGWDQAVTHTQALIDTWRPFNFQWGMSGHSQRVALLDPYGYDKTRKSHLLFSLDQSIPVFRNTSMNDDFLLDTEGKINAYGSWSTDDIVDQSDQREISLYVPDAPAGGSYGVTFPDSLVTDVIPDRLQNFIPIPESSYKWTWMELSDSTVIQDGSVTADSLGRLCIPQLTVMNDQPRRLIITAVIDPSGVEWLPNLSYGGNILESIYPNPFNNSTYISYTLPHAAQVRLCVYDAMGRKVRMLANSVQSADHHIVHWDGSNDSGRLISSGLYFLRMDIGAHTEIRRVLVVR